MLLPVWAKDNLGITTSGEFRSEVIITETVSATNVGEETIANELVYVALSIDNEALTIR